MPGSISYVASKGAVLQMTKTVRPHRRRLDCKFADGLEIDRAGVCSEKNCMLSSVALGIG
jgi:hypothetical protein